MTDTFKDIYAKDNDAQKEKKLDGRIVKTTDAHGNTIAIDPEDGAVVLDRPLPTMTVLDSVPEEYYKTPETVTLSEDIKNVLTEQREQSAKVLESVMKTNTKIANNVSKFVKSSAETNEKLVEAIKSLTDKIALLETKLDAIEKLEIPTPIVHVQLPSKTVNKEVHRDKQGIITHITETEVVDDEIENK